MDLFYCNDLGLIKFFLVPLAKKFFRAKPKQTGKKDWYLVEGIFARPLILGDVSVPPKAITQVNQNFAQKRVALRPVIATK